MDRALPTPATSQPESDRNAEIILGVLNAIDRDQHVTQRSVARDLNIALGLANAYLKRCVTKGLVKMREAPARRYAYYLTRKGFAEKSRLTTEYLSSSFAFFRNARHQMSSVLDEASQRRWAHLALAGGGDLAEIAMLCARDRPLTFVAVIDPHGAGRLHDIPVVQQLQDIDAVDAVVITDLKSPQDTYDLIVRDLGQDRILAPKLLGIRTGRGAS
jgi:predicted transcriptional regulator